MTCVATRSNLSTSNGLVMPPAGQPVLAQGLAFYALEIEELADVYFFRPLRFVAARLAAALRATPTQVTILSTVRRSGGWPLALQPTLRASGFCVAHRLQHPRFSRRTTGASDRTGHRTWPGPGRRRRIYYARGDLHRDCRGPNPEWRHRANARLGRAGRDCKCRSGPDV